MRGALRTKANYPEWPEAYVVAEPKFNQAEPVTLVKRRESGLVGLRGENLISLPGNPAISLFTGAGGFDLGIESAGFCTLVQHEWSRDACLTLMANRPRYFTNAALIQGDIRLTPTSMLLAEANLRVGETHLIVGGPPCQGFSVANINAAKGQRDVRNDLVFEYLRVVREAKPMFFSFENVPGFLSFNKGEYFKLFLEVAYECYYELVYGLINAVEYGVPQNRTRFICMGTRRDLVEIDEMLASLPAPSHFHQDDLNRLHILDAPLFRSEYKMFRHAPGIRYFPDRPVLIPPYPVYDQHRSNKFIEFYERLEKEEPDRIVEEPRRQQLS